MLFEYYSEHFVSKMARDSCSTPSYRPCLNSELLKSPGSPPRIHFAALLPKYRMMANSDPPSSLSTSAHPPITSGHPRLPDQNLEVRSMAVSGRMNIRIAPSDRNPKISLNDGARGAEGLWTIGVVSWYQPVESPESRSPIGFRIAKR